MTKNVSSSSCAVIGKPIVHSRSPQIHQWFGKQFAQCIDYQRIEAEPATFNDTVTEFFARGGRGMNVTTPFKQQAYALADIQLPAAHLAESGNTLWLENHRLHVTSTDGDGWYQHIQHLNITLTNKRILVLGAGGAGRVIFEFLKGLSDVQKIVLANRSSDKLAALNYSSNSLGVTLPNIPKENFDLIINALPTGWQKSFPDIELEMSHNTVAYDLNYAEGAKAFRDWFLGVGGNEQQFYDGWGMLVCQAALSYEIWWQQKPKTTELINNPGLITGY